MGSPPRLPRGMSSLSRPASLRSVGSKNVSGVGMPRGTFQRGLADLGGSIEVAFRQRGRERQRVGVVVETVTGSVGRQQGRPVNVEGQQVADCVGVFGAV